MSPCADAQVFGSLPIVTVPDSLIEEAARRFSLLSDPTRLRILALLLEREPMTVTELSHSLGIAAPNVSQHLARLSAGRLVGREKQGRTVQYRTTDPSLRPLCELMCTSLVEQAERLLNPPVAGESGLEDRRSARGTGVRKEAHEGGIGAGGRTDPRGLFPRPRGGQGRLLSPGAAATLRLRRLRLEAHQEVPPGPGHRPVAGAVGADPAARTRRRRPAAGAVPAAADVPGRHRLELHGLQARQGDGLAHFFVFWGFITLFIGTVILTIDSDILAPITDKVVGHEIHFFHGPFYLVYSIILDVMGLGAIVGLAYLIGRRSTHPPQLDYTRAEKPEEGYSRSALKKGDAVFAWFLMAVLVTGFLQEGFRIDASRFPSFEVWSPVGWVLAKASRGRGSAPPGPRTSAWGRGGSMR